MKDGNHNIKNTRRTKEIKEEFLEAKGGIRAYHRSIRKKWITVVILAISVFFLMLVSVNAGATHMNPWEVLKTLFGFSDETSYIVVWRIRMPRVIAALVAGAGLSIAGCVIQTTLKNPLASPTTLGISHAATFGANVAIIALGAGSILSTASDAVVINNPYLVTVCAFVGAMMATSLILGLSNLRGFTPQAVVLAGVALNYLFMAGTTLLQYFASDVQISAAIFWTFGDLGRISWNEVLILSIVVVLSIGYFLFKRWDYNAMANGEEIAKSLGVNTIRTRFWGLLVSSLITAVAVSFLGIIGFIDLIAPQIMKRVVGADHRFLIPASALLGAAILLLSDIAARMILSPITLPVGAITSLLGAPLFLYLLMKGNK